jgi:hypothetical protein
MTARFFRLFIGANVIFEREFWKELDRKIVFNKSVRRRELNAVVNVAQFQRAADGFDLQCGAIVSSPSQGLIIASGSIGRELRPERKSETDFSLFVA